MSFGRSSPTEFFDLKATWPVIRQVADFAVIKWQSPDELT
jgi:hypothetical protein